jgi:hypothetical protein
MFHKLSGAAMVRDFAEVEVSAYIQVICPFCGRGRYTLGEIRDAGGGAHVGAIAVGDHHCPHKLGARWDEERGKWIIRFCDPPVYL